MPLQTTVTPAVLRSSSSSLSSSSSSFQSKLCKAKSKSKSKSNSSNQDEIIRIMNANIEKRKPSRRKLSSSSTSASTSASTSISSSLSYSSSYSSSFPPLAPSPSPSPSPNRMMKKNNTNNRNLLDHVRVIRTMGDDSTATIPSPSRRRKAYNNKTTKNPLLVPVLESMTKFKSVVDELDDAVRMKNTRGAAGLQDRQLKVRQLLYYARNADTDINRKMRSVHTKKRHHIYPEASAEDLKMIRLEYNRISYRFQSLIKLYKEERHTQLLLEQEEAVTHVWNTIQTLLKAGTRWEDAIDKNADQFDDIIEFGERRSSSLSSSSSSFRRRGRGRGRRGGTTMKTSRESWKAPFMTFHEDFLALQQEVVQLGFGQVTKEVIFGRCSACNTTEAEEPFELDYSDSDLSTAYETSSEHSQMEYQ